MYFANDMEKLHDALYILAIFWRKQLCFLNDDNGTKHRKRIFSSVERRNPLRNLKMIIAVILPVCFHWIEFLVAGTSGYCSVLRGKFPIEMETKMLEAYTFDNVSTLTSFECAVLCSRKKLCRSVNFHPLRKECQHNVKNRANARLTDIRKSNKVQFTVNFTYIDIDAFYEVN